MDSLIFNNIEYHLKINEYQFLPDGSEVCFFGVAKSKNKESKWIGKIEKYHWFFLFREKKENKIIYFYIEIDYYDNAIKKEYYIK